MALGDSAAAVASFHAALDAVLTIEEKNHWIVPHNASESWQLISERIASAPHTAVQDDHGFLFFDQCFLIQPVSNKLHVVTRGDVDLMTATLLFNLALAYIGTRGKHADVVAQVCQTAFDVMGKVTVMGEGRSLLVALCNNIASLALDRQDFETFETHRLLLGMILGETGQPCFFANFFAGNFATTCDAQKRPAAAA